jgi:hypothetical protein
LTLQIPHRLNDVPVTLLQCRHSRFDLSEPFRNQLRQPIIARFKLARKGVGDVFQFSRVERVSDINTPPFIYQGYLKEPRLSGASGTGVAPIPCPYA